MILIRVKKFIWSCLVTKYKKDGRGQYRKEQGAKDIEVRINNINSCLTKIKLVKSEGITSFSERLAELYNQAFPNDKITPTTLRHNPNYRILLDQKIEKKSSSNNLTEKLAMAKLESRELRAQKKGYEDTISNLLTKVEKLESDSLFERIEGSTKEVNTAPFEVIMKILTSFADEHHEISFEGIYDTGELKSRLVLSKEDYPEFFQWYFKNLQSD